VTINRRDLIAIPVPDANLLWRNLHVRKVERGESAGGKRQSDYHILARFLAKEQIAPEIREKLDAVVTVARHAKPRQD
jgi:urease alpha subunit